jgi:hypothetical protein
MFVTLFSNAHLKIPGKTNTLFNWFGKSLLHVAIIEAQAFFASSGIISGVGFAIAKITGLGAILLTISCVNIPGAETHINRSFHFIASVNPHFIHSLEPGSSKHAVFVILVSISFVGFNHFLHL